MLKLENIKYIIIYSFDVMSKITEGHSVYMLDRDTYEVYYVNDMTVADLASFLAIKDKSGRFEFWYEEKETGNGEL